MCFIILGEGNGMRPEAFTSDGLGFTAGRSVLES